jgi:hypothetical protein
MALTGYRLILLISLFIISCFYISSLKTNPPKSDAYTAASMLESVSKEPAPKAKAVAVNPVREARTSVPPDGNVSTGKGNAGLVNSLNGNNVVNLAMNEKDGGARNDVAHKTGGLNEQARKADDGRHLTGTTKPNVERHHSALAKANERKRAVIKPKVGKLVVQKSVKHRRRLQRSAPTLVRVSKRKLKPLTSSEWISPTRFWSMW